jgi:Protein of unknown function (DUF998)
MPASHRFSQSSALDFVGFAGVALFTVICVGVQFARADLDWVATPLSYYLVGPFGGIVIAAYGALGIALIAVGTQFYRQLMPAARSAAPLLLFGVGGCALTLTALSESAKSYGHPVEWEMVHLAAAETTFLCVTVAMLLQSFWLSRDPRWKQRAPFAFVLSIVTFAALWIYALWRALPRGLAQKIVIALILIWLGWAAIQLWRRRPVDA